MTVHGALKLIKQWHYTSINRTEKAFVDSMLSGLDGMGDVNDHDVKDYLTAPQEKFVWDIAKKFMITKKTKA